jgi:hypothetical protein
VDAGGRASKRAGVQQRVRRPGGGEDPASPARAALGGAALAGGCHWARSPLKTGHRPRARGRGANGGHGRAGR